MTSTPEAPDSAAAEAEPDAPALPAAVQRAHAALKVAFDVLHPRDGTPCIEVKPEDLHAALLSLRDDAGFEGNTFVTAIDRSPAEPRFELVHQLLSFRHNDRLRVVVKLAGDMPSVASASDLYPGTLFSERECYDMFGIRFDGHPDLRRLLMPEHYEHHPLRKEFPHQGIEPDKLYRQWEEARRLAEEATEGARG